MTATTTSPQKFRIYDREADLPALRMVYPPRRCRTIARFLGILFVFIPLFVGFVPWQQNIQGTGRVIAFDPTDRPQSVRAPIQGQIAEWFVKENEEVKKGDPIVRLVDNDPDLRQRTERQRDAIEGQITSLKSTVELLNLSLASIRSANESLLKSIQFNISAAKQRLREAKAEIERIEADLVQHRFLRDNSRKLAPLGIESQEILKQHEQTVISMEKSLEKQKAQRDGVSDEIESLKAQFSQQTSANEAQVKGLQAQIARVQADIQEKNKQLEDIKRELSRLDRQLVTAPRDGMIFRILFNEQGTGQVMPRDELAVIVPEVENRVVEIYVNGVDQPLINIGDPVRIQFEGWPAVQFVGWPSVARGTFGGQVKQIDSTDTENGRFRIIVEPYPADDPRYEKWPDNRYLRQGVRAKAWVLLKQVDLWFEIWRRLNGFPLTVSDTEPGSSPASVQRIN